VVPYTCLTMASDDFTQYCCDLLAPGGACTARKMFGGWNIKCDGLSIALIAGQRLYLKVDAQTKEHFRQAGCEPFVYGDKGQPMEMSYWSAPEDAMDSPSLMSPWARLAMEAALRSRPKPKAAKKPAKPAR
jgi:DNA transformation protein and related proteins